MPIISSTLVGQHFAFANGRIGVLKLSLLSNSDLDRLLGAHNTSEIEQIFLELKFTDGIDQGVKGGDSILNAVSNWTFNEVNKMAPDSKKPIFNILWMEGDLPLIAYLLKSFHGLSSSLSQKPEQGIGAYKSEEVESLIKNGKSNSLPSHLQNLIKNIKENENITPKKIDTLVSKYGAETKLRLAKASGSKDILKFVKHNIDCSNIRTSLRLLSNENDDLNEMLLTGGTIPLAEFKKSFESILSAVLKSELSYFLSDVFSKGENIDTHELEKSFASLRAADIAQMWNVPLSIEPIFAFASLALWNISLMRVVLIGKRNGLSPQEIKQALPPFLSSSHYVI